MATLFDGIGANGFSSGYAAGNEIRKQRGLASGVQAYVDAETAGDKAGMRKALGVMAGVAPAETMNWINQQKALEQKQNEIPTSIRELEYIQNHPELKDLYIQSKRGVNINNNLNPFDRKRIENIASNIDKNISEATEKYELYDQADKLLDKVDTGGWSGIFHKATPEDWMGDDSGTLNSLMSKLAPQQRPAGSGNTSDKDMDLYKKATISWGKSNEANKRVVAMGKAMAQNDMAHEELRAEWVSKNLGSLTDFDKLWRQYVNEQRIYDDNGNVNKNRVNPYDWFANALSGNQNKTKTTTKPKYTITEIKG